MRNKNRKKLFALAMAAVLAVGGKGVLTDAASESGVLEIPLTRASSSGMYGSVEWSATLTLSGSSATAKTVTQQPARNSATISAVFQYKDGTSSGTIPASGSGRYVATATVSISGATAKRATSTHSVEGYQVISLSEMN